LRGRNNSDWLYPSPAFLLVFRFLFPLQVSGPWVPHFPSVVAGGGPPPTDGPGPVGPKGKAWCGGSPGFGVGVYGCCAMPAHKRLKNFQWSPHGPGTDLQLGFPVGEWGLPPGKTSHQRGIPFIGPPKSGKVPQPDLKTTGRPADRPHVPGGGGTKQGPFYDLPTTGTLQLAPRPVAKALWEPSGPIFGNRAPVTLPSPGKLWGCLSRVPMGPLLRARPNGWTSLGDWVAGQTPETAGKWGLPKTCGTHFSLHHRPPGAPNPAFILH